MFKACGFVLVCEKNYYNKIQYNILLIWDVAV